MWVLWGACAQACGCGGLGGGSCEHTVDGATLVAVLLTLRQLYAQPIRGVSIFQPVRHEGSIQGFTILRSAPPSCGMILSAQTADQPVVLHHNVPVLEHTPLSCAACLRQLRCPPLPAAFALFACCICLHLSAPAACLRLLHNWPMSNAVQSFMLYGYVVPRLRLGTWQ